MKKQKATIAFLGLAQNCSRDLHNFFDFIDEIQNDFKNIYFYWRK